VNIVARRGAGGGAGQGYGVNVEVSNIKGMEEPEARASWTWEEISTDWLAGNLLAIPPADTVAAFNTVDKALGRAWMEASRTHSGVQVRGTEPTLGVVTAGQMIANLDGVAGADRLVEGLRKREQSIVAELTAVHLIRLGDPTVSVEIGPVAQVGARSRKPDFRLRREGEPWVYVEVTQPDVAEAQTRAQAVLNRFADLVQPIKRSFALEIFLRREPTDTEISELADLVPQFCTLKGDQSRDLPGLAILSLNASAPGLVVPFDHPAEPNVPRLLRVRAIFGPDEPHRHISVRMAYADDRAEAFLRRKAKQLPNDSPGLIMVQMSRAPGGVKSWEPILKRRFQRGLHTRVGAVCLFRCGHELTPDGEAWVPEAKFISNPHARFPLAAWIREALSRVAPARTP